MKVFNLQQQQLLPLTREQAWDFFSSPRNLDDLTPPSFGFRVTHLPSETLYEGLIVAYRVRIAPALWVPWVSEIKSVEPLVSFVDEQRSGPYRFWHHRHHFEPVRGGILMTDLIHYALPLGPLGTLAHAVFVRRQLESIFRYRREVLEKLFLAPSHTPPSPSMDGIL